MPSHIRASDEEAIKTWLCKHFRVSPSKFIASSKAWESFMGHDPSNQGMQERWWPDLWFQAGPDARRVTFIQHVVPCNAAKERPTNNCIIHIIHRFWY
eukprot:174200-Chlamydomonas_euryale.AAC.1